MNDDEIERELFGQRLGQIPKDVRESIQFASDALNAYMRGMSIPEVALSYRYEPGSAELMLRGCMRTYGAEAVLNLLPTHIASLLSGA